VWNTVDAAFGHVGLDWRKYVKSDPRYMRPAEVDVLQADPSKAKRELGWSPTVKFGELVAMMVDADLEAIGMKPKGAGHHILEEKFGKWHQWAGSVSSCLEAAPGHALGD